MNADLIHAQTFEMAFLAEEQESYHKPNHYRGGGGGAYQILSEKLKECNI